MMGKKTKEMMTNSIL